MENYVVSARKYRPGIFSDVIGQTHITDTLKKAIKGQRFAHSYLFCGPHGVGKTTCARILAKAINCTNLSEEGEPCNECKSCKSFQESSSLNIYELDAASNNHVEDIRNLIDQVRFPPQSGKYKVYVIDEVHMLSQSAFNAFLKTLEEPPDYAIFILATTEKQKILPTILSRCQIFDFNRISVTEIADQLQKICDKESVDAEPEALQIIAQKSTGALRDALSLFDKVVSFSGKKVTYQNVINNLNILDYDYFFKITDALLAEDAGNVLNIFNRVIQNGFAGDDFINGLSQHFRDLLVCKEKSTLDLLEVTGQLKERYQQQAKLAPSSFLVSALDIANRCDVGYKASKNKRLHVEMALIKMGYLNSVLDLSPPVSSEKSERSTSKETKKNTKSSSEKSNKKVNEPEPNPSKSNSEKSPNNGTYIERKKKTKAKTQRKDIPSFKMDPPSESKEKESSNGAQKQVKQQNGGTDVKEQKQTNGRTSAINEEELVDHWQTYSKQIEGQSKSHFYSFMRNKRPKLKDNNTIAVEVNNGIEKQRVHEEKTALMEFLRNKLDAPGLEMDIKVASSKPKERKPYTTKEKYQQMVRKNPALKKLKDKFDLNIEF